MRFQNHLKNGGPPVSGKAVQVSTTSPCISSVRLREVYRVEAEAECVEQKIAEEEKDRGQGCRGKTKMVTVIKNWKMVESSVEEGPKRMKNVGKMAGPQYRLTLRGLSPGALTGTGKVLGKWDIPKATTTKASPLSPLPSPLSPLSV
jgi:hypothetical protein